MTQRFQTLALAKTHSCDQVAEALPDLLVRNLPAVYQLEHSAQRSLTQNAPRAAARAARQAIASAARGLAWIVAAVGAPRRVARVGRARARARTRRCRCPPPLGRVEERVMVCQGSAKAPAQGRA